MGKNKLRLTIFIIFCFSIFCISLFMPDDDEINSKKEMDGTGIIIIKSNSSIHISQIHPEKRKDKTGEIVLSRNLIDDNENNFILLLKENELFNFTKKIPKHILLSVFIS